MPPISSCSILTLLQRSGQLHLKMNTEMSRHQTDFGLNAVQTEQASRYEYKFLHVWKRALFKIKVRNAVNGLNSDILIYGTSNNLVDIDSNFKENLDSILEAKMAKRETFRL